MSVVLVRMKRLQILLVLAAMLLLSACTTVVYRQADWLIPWYVDDLVDISRQQRAELKDDLVPFLQWHREEELQNYLVLLDEFENDLATEVTAAQVRRWFEHTMQAFERAEARFLEVSLEFSEQLSDEQMQEFMLSLYEKQEEMEEEFLERSYQEYVEDNYEFMSDFMKRFTGRLQDVQEKRFQQAAEELVRLDSAWLEDRRNWLNTLEPLLQRPAGWKEGIRQAYRDRKSKQDPEYLRLFEHNLMIIAQADADVLNQMSDKQRRHVTSELAKWRQKFRKMMENPN